PVEDWLDFQLLRHGHLCERVGAVGESVAQELRFLDRGYRALPLPVIPHGNQPIETSWQARRESRERVLGHLREALGLDCRLLLTHIARDAVCKALGRDVTVCEYLAELLPPEARPAVLLIVTEWEPGAPSEEIRSLRARAAAFNARQQAVHLHLLNQADWPRGLGFTREDLHRATDVTLGQSMYESFGLAQLEPLSCGAICVLSGVSGARYRLRELCARPGTSEEAHPNLVVADYSAAEEEPGAERSVEDWLRLGGEELERHERRCARRVARRLVEKLPWDEAGQRRLQETGRRLAERMAWEPLIREQLVPFLSDGWPETSTDRRDT
ncbi:MAG TPA: hypothetical protein VLQ93_00825, partial [Myxococcaceae bacterium]|nr:hypothetical protein [Myxococcaceae bacterium]